MKIIALAYNYKDYNRFPIIFMKRGIIEEGDTIRVPRTETWAEVELGFMVGHDLEVGPYLLANDVTTAYTNFDVHLAQSKCMDTYCPIKPIYDVPDPNNVELLTIVNGEVVQKGCTKDRIMNDEYALHWIKRFMTMEPGDIVLTGTPPHDRPLIKPGDIVTVETVGIGSLTNPVELWKPSSR